MKHIDLALAEIENWSLLTYIEWHIQDFALNGVQWLKRIADELLQI